jgi:hypothetical protein
MAEWGRKEYTKAWPSRRPVWTWGAFFLSLCLAKIPPGRKRNVVFELRSKWGGIFGWKCASRHLPIVAKEDRLRMACCSRNRVGQSIQDVDETTDFNKLC